MSSMAEPSSNRASKAYPVVVTEIAIENGHLELTSKLVIFHCYVNIYQSVNHQELSRQQNMQLPGTVHLVGVVWTR